MTEFHLTEEQQAAAAEFARALVWVQTCADIQHAAHEARLAADAQYVEAQTARTNAERAFYRSLGVDA